MDLYWPKKKFERPLAISHQNDSLENSTDFHISALVPDDIVTKLVYAVLFAKEPLFFHFVFDGHPFLLALASGSSHYWISFLYIVLFCKHFF